MKDAQGTIDALQAKVVEMQRTIDQQRQEIHRLTTGTVLTVLLLTEEVRNLTMQAFDMRLRMSGLEGRSYVLPTAAIEH
jgi:hypothetical protein